MMTRTTEVQSPTAEMAEAVGYAIAADQVRTALCSARRPEETPGAGDVGSRMPPTDHGWARYITHVSECPDCRSGIDCRTAERLHAAWKAEQRAAR